MPHRTLAVQSYAGTLAMIKPSPGVVLAPTRGSYYTRATSCSLLESTTWRKHNLVVRKHNLVTREHNLVAREHNLVAKKHNLIKLYNVQFEWREYGIDKDNKTVSQSLSEFVFSFRRRKREGWLVLLESGALDSCPPITRKQSSLSALTWTCPEPVVLSFRSACDRHTD